MENNIRKRNHYVPQFYLKNWTTNVKVCVYNNLVSSKTMPEFQYKIPKSIAYIENLYTDIKLLEETDEFELWISDYVELPYQKTEEKILNNIKLESQDYKNLVRYAMAQFWRVPYNYFGRYSSVLETFQPKLQKSLEKTMSSLENRVRYHQPLPINNTEMKSEELPIKLNKYQENGNMYLNVEVLGGRKSWLYNIKRMVNDIAEKTSKHKWQIINALEGTTWLTSDNPVTLLNHYSDTNYNFNGAWKMKNTDIFMPISPQYLLFTEVGSRAVIENNVKLQSFINRMIIENSFLQVYSTEPYKYISSVRPREVNAVEYKRINSLLKSWHPFHIVNEANFWTE